MNLELVIHNIGFVVSFLVLLGLGTLVYARRTKGAAVNVIFFIYSLVVCAWQAAYCLGVNVHDPLASRWFFFVTLIAAMFMLVLNAELILVMTGRFAGQKKIVKALYAIATLITVFYLFFPDSLVTASMPLRYLPNFFVAGNLYAIQDYFFYAAFLYLLIQFFISYRKADPQMKNRLKYFIVAYLFGYSMSFFPEFALLGYNVDPFPASLTGLYGIPMAYALLKYNAIDINLLARRALGYALGITAVALTILAIGYANDTITAAIPGFPQWFLPLISGMIAVALGVFVWKKIKEVDELKFEFIDVVTHKFRTPLTHIRWSVENLRTEQKPEERAVVLSQIEEANASLFDLTNVLTGLSGAGSNDYLYTFANEDVTQLVSEASKAASGRLQGKHMVLQNEVHSGLPQVYADRSKLQFALQMMLENAATYSTEGGKVIVRAEQKGAFVIISVVDFGIGITKDELPKLFSKFYRGQDAVKVHTEGLGIGLYLARDILHRNGGDISVKSEGTGKGATFFMKIPVGK